MTASRGSRTAAVRFPAPPSCMAADILSIWRNQDLAKSILLLVSAPLSDLRPGIPALASCARVCKAFANAVTNDYLWKALYIRDFGTEQNPTQASWRDCYRFSLLRTSCVELFLESPIELGNKVTMEWVKAIFHARANLHLTALAGIPAPLPVPRGGNRRSYMMFEYELKPETRELAKVSDIIPQLTEYFDATGCLFFTDEAAVNVRVFLSEDKRNVKVLYDFNLYSPKTHRYRSRGERNKEQFFDPFQFLLNRSRKADWSLYCNAVAYAMYSALRRMSAAMQRFKKRKVIQKQMSVSLFRFLITELNTNNAKHGAHEWTTREPFLKLDELIDGLVRLTITSDQGNSLVLRLSHPFPLLHFWICLLRSAPIEPGENEKELRKKPIFDDGSSEKMVNKLISELEDQKRVEWLAKHPGSLDAYCSPFLDEIVRQQQQEVSKYSDRDAYTDSGLEDVRGK